MRFGGWRGRRNDVQPISFSRTTTQSSYAIKIIQPIEPISFYFILFFLPWPTRSALVYFKLEFDSPSSNFQSNIFFFLIKTGILHEKI
jgi:hypothetical protein